MKIIHHITNTFIVIVTTLTVWLSFDFIGTYFMDTHGFSTWFQSDKIAGRTHKANFEGMWGGPLDDFYVKVSIGENSERKSSKSNCGKNSHKILFLGDSTTAGFEVNNSETFISHINSSCNTHNYSGINLGIRGGDTHSAIGMYQKFAPIIAHKTIFYMITSNDYWENIDRNEYANLTKRFGRKFENEIIQIQNNWITETYLNIRVFVSEYFYFTTKVIKTVGNFNIYNNDIPKYYLTLEAKKEKVLAETPKLVELLDNFERNIKNKNTKLIVTSYPCVSYKTSETWDPETCKVNGKLEDYLSANLKEVNPNIQYWDSNKFVQKYVAKGCFELKSLTFNTDRHFSSFGHFVFAQIIKKHLFNDLNYDKSVIC